MSQTKEVEESLRRSGIAFGEDGRVLWLVSPDPFVLTPTERTQLEEHGADCAAFLEAVHQAIVADDPVGRRIGAQLGLTRERVRLTRIESGYATNVPMVRPDVFWDRDGRLTTVEIETMKTLRELLAKLKQSKEDGATLLDRTTVFLGSNLGDGSSHSVRNLPVLLAGGGFRHGQHLSFDPQNPPPLCNLFVSMLQRLGIETDRFSSGTGILTGLALAG